MRGEASLQSSSVAGHRKRMVRMEYQVRSLRQHQSATIPACAGAARGRGGLGPCVPGDDAEGAGEPPRPAWRRLSPGTAFVAMERRLDSAIDAGGGPRGLQRAVRVVHGAAWFSTRLTSAARGGASALDNGSRFSSGTAQSGGVVGLARMEERKREREGLGEKERARCGPVVVLSKENREG